ncbi:MAG: Ig-like domain-containing protein [Herbinix sp.]|nr:Ig-like domain-containing protein [Herbinix sp.]
MPSVYNIKMDVLKTNILRIGETYDFMVSNPDDILISFKSNDQTIARVDENGVISGVDLGTTNITAYNANLDIEQSCRIVVK